MNRARLIVALFVAVFSVAPRAGAFCQATTCDPMDVGQTCERHAATRCVTSGQGLFWASSCLTISVQRDGAPAAGIDYDTARASVQRAFDTWTEVDCNGEGERPSLRVEVSEPVACDESEYSSDRRNANIVMFREDEWPYVGAEDALGLTRLRFDAENVTGEIYDVDIEINALREPLSTGEPGPREVDLDSLLIHEAGHALGLAHTLDKAASMRVGYTPGSTDLRTLASDDIAGICGLYAPSRTHAGNNCEPRHGFSELCASEQPEEPEPAPSDPVSNGEGGSSSCVLGAAPAAAGSLPSAALLLVGACWLVRARRRRHEKVIRSFLADQGKPGDKPAPPC